MTSSADTILVEVTHKCPKCDPEQGGKPLYHLPHCEVRKMTASDLREALADPYYKSVTIVPECHTNPSSCRIADTLHFNTDFPESYQWDSVENLALQDVAVGIVRAINRDSLTPEKALVPGLRSALSIIALHFSV